MTHTYKVTGMTGDVCKEKVQNALQKVEGVTNVNVNVAKEEAEVSMKSHIDTQVFKDALKAYPEYQLSEKDGAFEKPFSKEHLFAQILSLLSNRNMVREYFASSPLAHIRSIAHSKSDEQFLENLNNTISNSIEDTDLDVEKLAGMMNMSRVTLYRKIKAISNRSPLELINIIRLKKAAELLARGDYRIYEISAIVGYSSQSNFTRNFQKQFNMTPTEYMHSLLK